MLVSTEQVPRILVRRWCHRLLVLARTRWNHVWRHFKRARFQFKLNIAPFLHLGRTVRNTIRVQLRHQSTCHSKNWLLLGVVVWADRESVWISSWGNGILFLTQSKVTVFCLITVEIEVYFWLSCHRVFCWRLLMGEEVIFCGTILENIFDDSFAILSFGTSRVTVCRSLLTNLLDVSCIDGKGIILIINWLSHFFHVILISAFKSLILFGDWLQFFVPLSFRNCSLFGSRLLQRFATLGWVFLWLLRGVGVYSLPKSDMLCLSRVPSWSGLLRNLCCCSDPLRKH